MLTQVGRGDRFEQFRPIVSAGDYRATKVEEGSPLNLQLADPVASVAVRDKNNQMEYLG